MNAAAPCDWKRAWCVCVWCVSLAHSGRKWLWWRFPTENRRYIFNNIGAKVYVWSVPTAGSGEKSVHIYMMPCRASCAFALCSLYTIWPVHNLAHQTPYAPSSTSTSHSACSQVINDVHIGRRMRMHVALFDFPTFNCTVSSQCVSFGVWNFVNATNQSAFQSEVNVWMPIKNFIYSVSCCMALHRAMSNTVSVGSRSVLLTHTGQFRPNNLLWWRTTMMLIFVHGAFLSTPLAVANCLPYGVLTHIIHERLGQRGRQTYTLTDRQNPYPCSYADRATTTKKFMNRSTIVRTDRFIELYLLRKQLIVVIRSYTRYSVPGIQNSHTVQAARKFVAIQQAILSHAMNHAWENQFMCTFYFASNISQSLEFCILYACKFYHPRIVVCPRPTRLSRRSPCCQEGLFNAVRSSWPVAIYDKRDTRICTTQPNQSSLSVGAWGLAS